MTSASPRPSPGPEIDADAAGAAGRGATRLDAAAPCSAARSTRPPCCAASRSPARRSRGPAIVELPEATLAVPPGWPGRVEPSGTMRLERARERRRGHAAGRLRRAARRLRGDGRRARQGGALGQHQGAPRLLLRAVRRRRRDGHAGRAHPRPPRRDAGRRRGGAWASEHAPGAPGSSTTRTAAARTCPTSRSSRPPSPTTARCSASPPTAPTTPTSAARRPGSMPADSTTLADEGVVIAPRVLDEAAIDELVAQMRQPAQRRADLRAQLAANRTGVERLRELARPRRPRRAR